MRPRWQDWWTKLTLLLLLVRRDLSARYQGSVLGNFWPLFNQLAQLLIYTYVFSVVLQVRLSMPGRSQDSPLTFGLWLFAGLVPWIAVSTGAVQACMAVVNQPNLVKKVVFPLSLLPLVSVGVTFLESTFGLMLLLAFSVVLIGKLSLTLLLLPLVWVVQLLLTVGLAYWGAGLTVFMRDIPQVAAVGVNLWFYCTPIIYPANLIPEQFTPLVIWLNPMTAIVENYRSMIIFGQDIHWNWLGAAFLISLAIFLSGFSLYKRLQPGFADVI